MRDKTRVIASRGYEAVCRQAIERFSEGELIFSGRNEIRLLVVGGTTVVVKRFKKNNLLKSLIYTFLPTKAEKAFRHARELERRGVSTPSAYGYAVTGSPFSSQCYLVTAQTDYRPIKDFTEGLRSPEDAARLKAFARFVASLHEKGVVDKDLNNTNVLYHEADGRLLFQLIDINRMAFYPQGALPKRRCLHNLTLFCGQGEVFNAFLRDYLEARGMEGDYALALEIKQQHDRRFYRKRRLKKMFRR